jgi:hypothetical protein
MMMPDDNLLTYYELGFCRHLAVGKDYELGGSEGLDRVHGLHAHILYAV